MTAINALAVLDLDDDAETHARIRALSNPTGGCIVAEIRPGQKRFQQLADDLLVALGKVPARSGADRRTTESWARVVAWTVGENVRHIIVTRAHFVPSSVIIDFVELAAITQARLVFVDNRAALARTHLERLQDLAIPTTTLAETPWSDIAPSTAPAPTATSGAPTTALILDQLPEQDFPVFFATCRATLPPTLFGAVARVYSEQAQTVHEQLTKAGSSTLDILATILRHLTEASTSPGHSLVRLRATQAAALTHGILVSTGDRLTFAQTRPRADDPAALAALRGYSSTRLAAAGLLACLTDAPFDLIAGIRLADVAPDGASVVVDGEPIPVAQSAAGILRSHRIRRLLSAAGPADGFIESDTRAMGSSNGGAISSAKAVRNLLTSVVADTGLAVTGKWHPNKDEAPTAWAKRAGFRLIELEQVGR